MSNHHILDSGSRRVFESGAVRDILEGKGRCDLMPLDIVSNLLSSIDPDVSSVLSCIYRFTEDKDVECLYDSIKIFSKHWSGNIYTSLLEVAIHYEEGCKKYGERNWEKGINVHCYIDSGVRHLLKYARGDDDEPHARAFIWNMLGAIWTIKHVPDMMDV